MAAGINRILAAVKVAGVPTVDEFMGPSHFTSKAAYLRTVEKQRSFLSVFGEFGVEMQLMTHPKASPHLAEKRQVLLDLYNKSGHGNVLRGSNYASNNDSIAAMGAPSLSVLAESTAKQLAFQRNQIAAKAEDLMKDGQALADAFFEMRGERSAIDAQIMDWVKDQAGKDGGVAQIRKTAMDEPQLAAVLYNAPNFLLGINEKSHAKLRLDVVERHAPSAYKAMDQGVELQGLVPRYDKAIAGIHSSFYNPTIADQAASHVEVA